MTTCLLRHDISVATVFTIVNFFVFLTISPPARCASPDVDDSAFGRLDSVLEGLLKSGDIVGAQVVAGKGGDTKLSRSHGVLAPDNPRPVDEDTLFLIGSTSKPFAAVCVMTLVEDPGIDLPLGDGIDRWLPAFGNASLQGGGALGRCPTTKELLSHRAGIYSQKRRLTRRQTSLIRDFRRDLETAVDSIAAEPMIAEPGEAFNYSGAGYCVVGRIAEIVASAPFEALLQERICEPLGLEHTTYFPGGRFGGNIAVGFGAEGAPHNLGDEHAFPLIGGSLYSTAQDMTRFARAILAASRQSGAANLLTSESIDAMTTRPDFNAPYGLGWSLSYRGEEEGGRAPIISHSGSLLSYRALLRIDLDTGAFTALAWTLASSESDSPAREAIRNAVRRVLQDTD